MRYRTSFWFCRSCFNQREEQAVEKVPVWLDPPSRFSLQIVALFFAAHLNHLEHFLYKAGYIHVSFCCQAFGFSVSFAKVLATIYMCLYISYLIFSLNHKEYLLPVSSFRKALITHYVFGMQCFATVYILSDLFYLLIWNISILNTLDNVSSFLLSVRCCVLATLYISSDLNYLFITCSLLVYYLFIWNIIIRQCVKLWFISWDVVIGYTIRSSAPFFIGSTFSDFTFFEPSSGNFHYYIIKFWFWIVMQCDGEQKGVALGWVR